MAPMVLHLVRETLHQRAIEPFGLPVRLGFVGRREIMPHRRRAHTASKNFAAH